MKILFSVFTIFCLFLFNSCSNNSGNPTGAGGGFGGGDGGGGGGGSVTFGITTGPGTTATNTFFFLTPNAAVTVKTITVSLPAQNLNDPYTGDGTTVFPANQPQKLNQEYIGVATGQKWVFVVTGNLGSATGTAYTATSNYTIP